MFVMRRSACAHVEVRASIWRSRSEVATSSTAPGSGWEGVVPPPGSVGDDWLVRVRSAEDALGEGAEHERDGPPEDALVGDRVEAEREERVGGEPGVDDLAGGVAERLVVSVRWRP
jgi:hypothetical protein